MRVMIGVSCAASSNHHNEIHDPVCEVALNRAEPYLRVLITQLTRRSARSYNPAMRRMWAGATVWRHRTAAIAATVLVLTTHSASFQTPQVRVIDETALREYTGVY